MKISSCFKVQPNDAGGPIGASGDKQYTRAGKIATRSWLSTMHPPDFPGYPKIRGAETTENRR